MYLPLTPSLSLFLPPSLSLSFEYILVLMICNKYTLTRQLHSASQLEFALLIIYFSCRGLDALMHLFPSHCTQQLIEAPP